MAMNETPYAETEVLLAVMNDDTRRMHELLDDMLPNELSEFEQQLRVLRINVESRIENKEPRK